MNRSMHTQPERSEQGESAEQFLFRLNARQRSLYEKAKAAAHEAKLCRDLIIKTSTSVMSGIFAGNTFKNMNYLASVGAVAVCGAFAWAGDYAYEWAIKKPADLIKRAVRHCCGRHTDAETPADIIILARPSEDAILADAAAHDGRTPSCVGDEQIVERAQNDACPIDYKSPADKITELYDAPLDGACICNTSALRLVQGVLLCASIATPFIFLAPAEPVSEDIQKAARIISGIITGAFTAVNSAMPYIAYAINKSELDRAPANRHRQRINITELEAAKGKFVLGYTPACSPNVSALEKSASASSARSMQSSALSVFGQSRIN